MSQLPDAVRDWRARGQFENIAGLDVFTLAAGNQDAEAILLHGFPSSSYDWHLVVDRLAAQYRVLALDLPGFGLSEKPWDYSYSLMEQADVVEMWLMSIEQRSVHIVAHDMGTSVATELIARAHRSLLHAKVRSVLLMNGSVHIDMAKLTPPQLLLRSAIGPLFARVGSQAIFETQLARILHRPVPREELLAMWGLLCHRKGKERLPQIIRYLEERKRFARRWVGSLAELDAVPAHVLWGTEDPVAVIAIGERLASQTPGASLERLHGVGHYPQLEAPEQTAEAILRFIESAG